MYTVYQHWDPLKICIVGKTYPPEFYKWIKDPKTREKFENLAVETEQDYQKLINLLTTKFDVKVMRPELPLDFDELLIEGKWVQPPTAPRDYFIMIRDQFFIPRIPNASHAWSVFFRQNKQSWWPDYVKPTDFYESWPEYAADIDIKFKAFQHKDQQHLNAKLSFYSNIFDEIQSSGTEIVHTDLDFINGCFVTRAGDDLFFATQTYYDDKKAILQQVDRLFPNTSNHVVNAGGHGDAVYCPVAPGLIISLNDIPTYADTFPGWEVVYLPPSNYAHMREFEFSMKRNKGRWFIPGFEQDTNLAQMVDHYFDEWVGQVSETVFDVNILIVDPKNIVVSSHNNQVEQACARHGIDVHVVPFRHKYFWDCGIHCITNDISRDGESRSFIK
jgi:N-dimethylarginine dimethylaminohydrolase